jgi:hypothetical protein
MVRVHRPIPSARLSYGPPSIDAPRGRHGNYLRPLKPHNPLKRPNSDERIQENPNVGNTLTDVSRAAKPAWPRLSKSVGGARASRAEAADKNLPSGARKPLKTLHRRRKTAENGGKRRRFGAARLALAGRKCASRPSGDPSLGRTFRVLHRTIPKTGRSPRRRGPVTCALIRLNRPSRRAFVSKSACP